MTNIQLVETLTNNLDLRHNLSSNKLRCINGQNLFAKVPDSGWDLVAAWDNEVAIVCDYNSSMKLGRSNQSMRLKKFYDALAEKRIMIHILNNVGRLSLPKHVRKISVQGIARNMLLKQVLRGASAYKYNAMDAWGIVWSEAITQYAANFVEQQNHIGSKLSSSVFANNLDHSGTLAQIREAVSKSDFGNQTDKLMTELTSSLYKAYSSLSIVGSEIRSKKDSQRSIGVKACLAGNRVELLTVNSMVIESPIGTNMFEQSDKICQMFDRLGLPLPEVFGYKFSQDNIPQLAVLNETMKEEVAHRLKQMSFPDEISNPDTVCTTNINTTTHLLA